MHEIGIADSILDVVRTEARQQPGSVLSKVAVRIGELAAVDPDALRFGFEALTHDTELESLELEIEICPRWHLCWKRNFEFRVDLLPYAKFDLAGAEANARRFRPGMEIVKVSSTKNDGLQDWLSWLEKRKSSQLTASEVLV